MKELRFKMAINNASFCLIDTQPYPIPEEFYLAEAASTNLTYEDKTQKSIYNKNTIKNTKWLAIQP